MSRPTIASPPEPAQADPPSLLNVDCCVDRPHGMSTFYLTTPIYYVNARPHAGARGYDHRG